MWPRSVERGCALPAGATVLGDDPTTLGNFQRMLNEPGHHQLLTHGSYDDFIINGISTSPKEVARQMLNSGFKPGTPIRCVSCKTGMHPDRPAYQLSRYLKSPVLAPTDRVRVVRDGSGSYIIARGGHWKQF